ncbi:hypothetical protein D3C73_1658100 [compost metagenome]
MNSVSDLAGTLLFTVRTFGIDAICETGIRSRRRSKPMFLYSVTLVAIVLVASSSV